MRISNISNISFTKRPNQKIHLTRQKVNILNPNEQDPEKILLIMSKNPVIFCTDCDNSNIAMEPHRGFVHSAYTPLNEE